MLSHVSILKSKTNSIDYLTSAKTTTNKRLVESITGLSVNFVPRQIDTTKYSSWEEVYADIDVSWAKHYTAIHIFGGAFSPGSGLSRVSKRVGVFPKDSGQLKFLSVSHVLYNCLVLLKINHVYKIPIHEMMFDPLEFSFACFHDDYKPSNYYQYHGYDIPSIGAHRLDSLQYFNNHATFNTLVKNDKVFDFVFGLTVLKNSDRCKFLDDVYGVASMFGSSKIFIRNDFTGENTFVDKEIYLDFISKSRYTYILPAYDQELFSIYRLIESINLDCLPLIHSAANTDGVSESFGFDLSILKNIGLCNLDERHRVTLLGKLKDVFNVVNIEFKN